MVLFSSMFFLGQFARDMDVSVSFSNNQIHEARTQEDREKHNAQMEKESPWIVVYRSPSHTHHSWKLGRRQVRFKQRDEFEAQIQWLISSVRQSLAKGCLVLVEGTWFNEDSVLTWTVSLVKLLKYSGRCHRSWTQRGARHQRQ